MANLGTLTIDLIAKSGKYTEGLNQAARATEKHTKEMQRSLKQLERQAEHAQATFKAAIAGGITIAAVSSVLEIGDNYKSMAERVKMATNSVVEYEYAQKRLLTSANTSFRSLAEAQELFIATSDNLRGGYGYTLEQALDVTDSLSYAFVRNATAADKAKTAINVYDRALATQKLTAQDWQSINSAVPTLAKNIGDAMGKSAQEINKMGMSGQLATSMMNEGLLKAKQENEDAANSMFNSIADAKTKFNNEFEALWGGLNDKIGASSGVAKSIIAIADNLEVVLVPAFALAGLGATKMTASLLTTSGSAAKATFEMHKLAGATRAVATAQTALSAISKVGNLLGGPVGIISLLVSGMSAYVMMSKDVTTANKELIKSSLELKESFNDIEASLTSMTAAQLEKNLGEQKELMSALKDELWDVELAYNRANDKLIVMRTGNGSFLRLGKGTASEIREQEKLVESLNEKVIGLKESFNGVDSIVGKLTDRFNGITKGDAESTAYLKMFDDLNQKTFELGLSAKEITEEKIKDLLYTGKITEKEKESLLVMNEQYSLQQSLNSEREKGILKIDSINDRYAKIGMSSLQAELFDLEKMGYDPKTYDDLKGKLVKIYKAPTSGGKTALNYFDDKLKSINEEIYKMKSLNDSIKLLGGESQYTAVRELTMEFNNQHSVLAKISERQRGILMLQAQELDSQKQINAIMMLGNDYNKNFDDMYFELSLVGQTKKAIEQLTFARELEKKAKELSIGMSPENIASLEEETQKILKLKEAYDLTQTAMDNDPFVGMKEGFSSYIDSMGTAREQFASVTESTFSSLTDGIANFAVGADKSFAKMTESILQNIAKMMIQMSILNAMKTGLGGTAFGDILGISRAVPNAPGIGDMGGGIPYPQSAPMVGMAHSGIDRVPQTGTWLLEKGERVVTSNTSTKLDRTLDRINSNNGRNGGITVNIHNNAPVQVETRQGVDESGMPSLEVFIKQVVSEVDKRISNGGSTAKILQGKYGLKTQAR